MGSIGGGYGCAGCNGAYAERGAGGITTLSPFCSEAQSPLLVLWD